MQNDIIFEHKEVGKADFERIECGRGEMGESS